MPLLLALAAPAASAQEVGAVRPDSACTPVTRWTTTRHFLFPEVVVPAGSGWLLLGQSTYAYDEADPRDTARADTSIAGVYVAEAGPARAVRRPPNATSFTFPRALPRSASGTDVIWGEETAVATSVMAARLDSGRWSEPHLVVRLPAGTTIARGSASELFAIGDRAYFAVVRRTPGQKPTVHVFTDSGPTFAAREVPLPFIGMDAIDLGHDGNRLVLMISAVANDPTPPGVVTRAYTWVLRQTESGWSAPLRVGGTGVHSAAFPTILWGRGPLIVAWVVEAPTRRLEWRAILPNGTLGPLQALAGPAWIQRANAPHDDLLAVRETDGTARVLRLRPDGYDELPLPESPPGPPPVVAGARGAPFVIVPREDDSAHVPPATLAGVALSCAVRRH